MVRLTSIVGALAISIATVRAAPHLSTRQNLPDPSGQKNLGNGQGIQFIGGQCNGVADCASQCCATLPKGGQTIGVCSGLGAQFQAGKQGCGFESGSGAAGNASSGGGAGNTGGNTPDVTNGNANDTPLTVVPITPPGTTVKPSTLVPDPAGAKNVGNGVGAQFITGGCTSDSDCASKCCALVNTGAETFGICSGPGANTQNGKQGCGFPVGGGQL
ncbi:hypothetical protein B0H67DRAFT_484172 [Lasiosphaeris hirsuta]|uniref:Biotrophy-associated secreted protein 2 n=1 Tax=Lasiosphaeris hirsuta TaxID=260670 RepID=A0AA40ANU3_9PEZI|nr:hypothetical protein B0H67DRAFT_484172 [Lasiosphaeris hirsuta]